MASSELMKIEGRHLQELLECPICLSLVGPPLYQCKNGHMLCNGCHPKVSQCPTCRVALDRAAPTRNLAMEQLLAMTGFRYPCKNEHHGCEGRFAWGDEKTAHEKACPWRRVPCPCRQFGIGDTSNCAPDIPLNDVINHVKDAHYAFVTTTLGPTVFMTSFQVSNVDLRPQTFWWPSGIDDKLLLFIAYFDQDIKAFCRHVTEQPVRYRLSIGAWDDDYEISYRGVSKPIDHQFLEEKLKCQALNIPLPMLSLFTSDKGNNNTSLQIKVEIL